MALFRYFKNTGKSLNEHFQEVSNDESSKARLSRVESESVAESLKAVKSGMQINKIQLLRKVINYVIIKLEQLSFQKAWLTNCFLCVTQNSLKLLSFDSILGRSANYSRYSPEQKAELGDMQPIHTLQVLSENTKQIFQICVKKQCSNLGRHISNQRNPLARKLPS